MSTIGLEWAYSVKTGSSTRKQILVALARWANEDCYAYRSIAFLERETELNRKTIFQALKKLQEDGFIDATGRMFGATGRTPEYFLPKLMEFLERIEAGLNGTKNGTVNKNSTENGTVIVPKTVPLNSTKNGTHINRRNIDNTDTSDSHESGQLELGESGGKKKNEIDYDRIADLIEKHIPEVPFRRDGFKETHAAKLFRARWNAKREHQDYEWWDEFFRVIALHQFWIKKWIPDSVGWFFGPRNFEKVLNHWHQLAERGLQ